MFGCKYQSYYLQAELKGLPLDEFLIDHLTKCQECQERVAYDEELRKQFSRD